MYTIAQSSRFFFILDTAAALRAGAAGRLVLCSGKWLYRIAFKGDLWTSIHLLYLTNRSFRKFMKRAWEAKVSASRVVPRPQPSVQSFGGRHIPQTLRGPGGQY